MQGLGVAVHLSLYAVPSYGARDQSRFEQLSSRFYALH